MTAGAAASELETIAAASPRQALRAMALRARASVDLAGGSPATSPLREALQLWQSVDAPYEVARTRMLLADSYRLERDASGARQELEAAATAFERLGALPDLARTREKLAALPGTQAVRTSRAFLFSDIVDSTRLAETVGDETWADLLRWHDAALRRLFLEHHGEEVDHAGDGFLVAFDSAAPAITCAVAVQRMLAAHRREHGFAPGSALASTPPTPFARVARSAAAASMRRRGSRPSPALMRYSRAARLQTRRAPSTASSARWS